MSDTAPLTVEAVSLLLEFLEQEELVISAGAARMHQDEVTCLETAGLLVPHDEIRESLRLSDFLRFEQKAN